ncbi:hypothetical protein GCM10023063_46820 [Arthrobacter methylotrophus]|uniref:hypothetical protein n=1 Tax=Arthrobacter methylotrophus TaxID=121291 RepID=UPI0031EB5049
MLDLDDVRWEPGRFGKLYVCRGKGSPRKGPKLHRMNTIACTILDCNANVREPFGRRDQRYSWARPSSASTRFGFGCPACGRSTSPSRRGRVISKLFRTVM